MKNQEIIFIVLIAVLSTAAALECYSCEEQSDNRKKCVTTTKQCLEFQDACTSYVQWQVPPYWTPRGERIYKISKDCDTRQGCQRRMNALYSMCKRDWYNDWACVECCTGDLCNYYVTMGTETVQSSIVTLLCGVLSILVLRRFL